MNDLMLMQARVAMATADVNIAVLTNQKARRAPAMRNTFFVLTCIPVEVKQSYAIYGIYHLYLIITCI